MICLNFYFYVGNVFSKNHILDILKVAEKHSLPIIADEIYEAMVFPGVEYNSFSALSKNVPILSCSGLSKRFLTPGIRLGWIIVHDRNDTLSEVKQGLRNVSARILGPNSTVQYAIPEILQNTPIHFFKNTMMKIAVGSCGFYLMLKLIIKFQYNAELAYGLLSKVPGLKPIKPKGAM